MLGGKSLINSFSLGYVICDHYSWSVGDDSDNKGLESKLIDSLMLMMNTNWFYISSDVCRSDENYKYKLYGMIYFSLFLFSYYERKIEKNKSYHSLYFFILIFEQAR